MVCMFHGIMLAAINSPLILSFLFVLCPFLTLSFLGDWLPGALSEYSGLPCPSPSHPVNSDLDTVPGWGHAFQGLRLKRCLIWLAVGNDLHQATTAQGESADSERRAVPRAAGTTGLFSGKAWPALEGASKVPSGSRGLSVHTHIQQTLSWTQFRRGTWNASGIC